MTDLTLFTEPQAASALNLKPRFLRELRRRGKVNFRRVGASIRYTHADLEAFIASCEQRQGTH